jgi:putative intracellular protease/amidase
VRFFVSGRTVRDGRLVTRQQQYSGAATARLVIAALGA